MPFLSDSSARVVTEFFREHLDDPAFELPRVNFSTGRTASVVARVLRVHGITIGRLVIIAPHLVEQTDGRTILPRDLIVHETTHVLQYREYGFVPFLWKYFGDYFRNLRREGNYGLKARNAAYLAIPFEVEARQTAFEFVRWYSDRVRTDR